MENNHARQAYWWAIQYLLKFRKLFTLLVLAGILISAMGLVIPKILQLFTDWLAAGQLSLNTLGMLALILMISLGIQTYLQSRSQVWTTLLTENAMQKLHTSMFAQLRRLGLPYIEKHSAGEILSLYQNEVQATQSMFANYFPRTMVTAIFLLFGFTYLASIHLVLTLAMLPFFLSYYLIGPYFERKAALYSKERAEKSSLMNKQYYNSVSSLLELNYMNAAEWDNRKLNQSQEDWIKSSLNTFFNAYMRGTVRRLSVALGSVFIFWLGASYIQLGQLSIGEFIAFTYLYFTVISRLTYLITNLTEQKILSQQIVRLHEFMKEQPAVVESSSKETMKEIKGEFELENVSFSYDESGTRPVVKSLSLHISRGENLAIVGPSGSGKSTLIKLIGRLYDPQAGSIKLDGTDLRSISFEKLRTAIGYVFQETYLFPGTIRENISFGNLDATEEEIQMAVEAAYADEFIDRLPEGLDTVVGERGYKLSGGQKQRIAIARLFLKNPPILLMDEATSALDNVSEKEVQRALERLMTGRTTVTIAHRLSTIKNADRIVLIHKGEVAEQGTFDELMAWKGRFYQMVGQRLLEEDREHGGNERNQVS